MKIPENKQQKDALYLNTMRECEASAPDRRGAYARRRGIYLSGSETIGRPLFNSVHDFVDLSSSYLYSPDSPRFGAVLPPKWGEQFVDELDALRWEAHRLWHDTPMTMIYDLGVEWCHVLGCTIFKNIASDGDGGLTMLPDPADFGVWNEAEPLSQQEAVCHWFDYPLARFERVAAGFPPELRAAMLASAREHAGPPQTTSDVLPDAVSNIVMAAASSASVQGAVTTMPDIQQVMAKVFEPCVRIGELWVRDDRLRCFRRAWIFMPTLTVLWDEPMGDQYDEAHAFHILTLEDVPGWLWGVPLIDKMIPLQTWEDARWKDIDLFCQLQLKPPYFLRGIQGRDGEKTLRIRTPGGEISSSDPQAEVKSLAPPAAVLTEIYALVDGIRKLEDRAAGLPTGMRSEAQQVRGGEQEVALAGLASPRLRRKASRVEATAGDIMTQQLRMARRRSDDTLYKANGEKFALHTVPGDLVVRIAAHSASPLYAQQARQVAQLLKQQDSIGAEDYVVMMDPAFADILAPKARRREKARGEAMAGQAKAKEEALRAKTEKDLATADEKLHKV